MYCVTVNSHCQSVHEYYVLRKRVRDIVYYADDRLQRHGKNVNPVHVLFKMLRSVPAGSSFLCSSKTTHIFLTYRSWEAWTQPLVSSRQGIVLRCLTRDLRKWGEVSSYSSIPPVGLVPYRQNICVL